MATFQRNNALLLMAACLSGSALGAGAETNAKSTPKQIIVTGCLERGVEAGCFILRDLKSKKVYNTLFKDGAPDGALAIRATGTLHKGPTICMQGIALDISKVVELRMRCPTKAEAPK